MPAIRDTPIMPSFIRIPLPPFKIRETAYTMMKSKREYINPASTVLSPNFFVKNREQMKAEP